MRNQLSLESLEERRLLSKSSLTHEFLEKPVDDKKPLAVHIEATVQIIIDGQTASISEDVGVVVGGKLPIHTKHTGGVLEIESTEAVSFHLGDFFTVWSDTPQGAQIVQLLETSHLSLVTVNGVRAKDRDLDDVVLEDHVVIVIEV